MLHFEQLARDSNNNSKVEVAPLRLEVLACKNCGKADLYLAGRMRSVKIDGVRVCEVEADEDTPPFR